MSEAHFLPVRPETAEPIEAESYVAMLQGPGTNMIRAASASNIILDRNGNATVKLDIGQIFFKGFKGLSIGTKKLLDLCCIKLTAINPYRPKDKSGIQTAVAISLEEYGAMRGYDIDPRRTETPEEAAAEEKRLSNIMHNIRKRVNAEMTALQSMVLSWREPGKKRDGDFLDITLVTKKGIINGYIILDFSEDFVYYLLQTYIMQYPPALQSMDERNPRLYYILYKLAYHYGYEHNQAKGTNNIISVRALLEACGDFPTFEEIQASKDRGHWERRIRDPLETALDVLQEIGAITCWEFSNSKCKPLTQRQLDKADYQTFIELFVHFEMPKQGGN